MAISSGGGSGVSGVTSDINVTPMADVMLVLLIIFMITTPLLQSGVSINLAKARNALEAPEVDAEDAAIVAVTRERRIYVNKEEVSEEALLDALIAASARMGDKPLFIRGDAFAPYGAVVTVVDTAREAGIERIGLLVDREREGQGGF